MKNKLQLLGYIDEIRHAAFMIVLSEEEREEYFKMADISNFEQLVFNGKTIENCYTHKYTDMLYVVSSYLTLEYHKEKLLNDLLNDSQISRMNNEMSRLSEERKFNRSVKIDYYDYEHDCFFWNDTFYACEESFVDDVLEMIEEDEPTFEEFYEIVPKYVEACDKKQYFYRSSIPLYLKYDEFPEDTEVEDFKGYEDLQNAWEEFQDVNKDVCYYYPNDKFVTFTEGFWKEIYLRNFGEFGN